MISGWSFTAPGCAYLAPGGAHITELHGDPFMLQDDHLRHHQEEPQIGLKLNFQASSEPSQLQGEPPHSRPSLHVSRTHGPMTQQLQDKLPNIGLA